MMCGTTTPQDVHEVRIQISGWCVWGYYQQARSDAVYGTHEVKSATGAPGM